MISVIPTGTLITAEVSAVIHQGLKIKLSDGRVGKLAILDEADQIVDDTPAIAREVWLVSIACYKNFLVGDGHLRVHSEPLPGIGKRVKNDHRDSSLGTEMD